MAFFNFKKKEVCNDELTVLTVLLFREIHLNAKQYL